VTIFTEVAAEIRKLCLAEIQEPLFGCGDLGIEFGQYQISQASK
jgi:hypothetical protein